MHDPLVVQGVHIEIMFVVCKKSIQSGDTGPRGYVPSVQQKYIFIFLIYLYFN